MRTNMLKCVLILGLISLSLCSPREERRHKHKHVDPFAALDHHISHTLAQHYLWPWSQLVRAAAALDLEESLEEPQIVSDSKKFEVNLGVRRYKPEELKIKVKNGNIVVEGRHKERDDDKQFMANHFVQRFVLPPGSKQEEVTAVLKENGVLTISVPRHELPPPLPEREVPIEVILPEETTEKVEKEEPTTEKKVEPVAPSSETPLEQLDVVEATTHVGKIRKKELKDTTKSTKDNEVTKGLEDNDLEDNHDVIE